MNYSIEDMVLDLARARVEQKHAKEEISRIEAEIAHTPFGKELAAAVLRLAAAKATDIMTDTDLREAALAEHSISGDKHPHKAVAVKIYTVLEYDVETAIMEAIEHFRWTLKLDKRKFDKIARDADFPFVTKRVEPRVSVARDLTSYLEAWEASVQDKADLTQAKAEANFVAELSDELAKKSVLGVAK